MRARRAVVLGVVLAGACAQEAAMHRDTTAGSAVRAESSVDHASSPVRARDVSSPDWAPAPVGAATFVVNRATRGMASHVRWALSPDSGAMIVIEDPAGVENEAVPDGVLFATERTGRTWRMDSVWSVSPAPDWKRVAFGRAVVLGGGERQQIAPSWWESAARSLAAIAGPQPAITAESLRAHSYPVSGMAVAEGAAATFVADVGGDEREAPVHFVSLDGWRVRWSADGRDLLIGVRPKRVLDDAAASSTRRVAATGGGLSSAPAADSVPWNTGPTLDISVPVARSERTLRARARVIEARANRITVRDSTAQGWSAPRDVGPGVPLALTRNGRFVLAVAPRTDAQRYESPDHAVVYRIP